MDNVEHVNLKRPFVDFLLMLATGATHGRATQDGRPKFGQKCRPVGVVTSIEGMMKSELQQRCIQVHFEKPRNDDSFNQTQNEREILARRDDILFAFLCVIQRFFVIREERRDIPDVPVDFREWWEEMCNLVLAYEEVASKPAGWAGGIIMEWLVTLCTREDEKGGTSYEHLIEFLLDSPNWATVFEPPVTHVHEGQFGQVHVTTTSRLLAALQKLNATDLPITADAFGGRLRDDAKQGRFSIFVFLDDSNGIPRSNKARRIGFFKAATKL
jgi:hypothetical protein